MKKRIFTLMMAFLAVASGAVWGQTYGTPDSPVEIGISFMNDNSALPTGAGFEVKKGTDSGLDDTDQSNKLTISKGGYYKLTGGNSNIQIIVSASEPVHITVSEGIHVDASMDNKLTNPKDYPDIARIWVDRCAMQINEGADVTLAWEGNCEFASGGLRAGINVLLGATLRLEGGTGTLTATSWNNSEGTYTCGAGIGGDSKNPNFGTIIIEDGNVIGRCLAQVAGWDAYGAGIGGGFTVTNSNTTPAGGTPSSIGTIIIKGGTVTGTTKYDYDDNENHIHTTGISAAIGGGYHGTCTNIAILGGTVDATTGDEADAIGVGKDYPETEGITKGIVIGKWDENTDFPEITGDINQKNIADGRDGRDTPSIKGNVTMPAETQIYVEYGWGDVSNFKSYNIDLKQTSLTEEGEDGEHASQGDVTKYAYYYYGPEQSFTVEDLSCDDGHLFLGWYENNQHYVSSKEGSATFTMSNKIPTSTTTKYYYSVWVDNRHEIAVATGTSWTENATITPKISYEPDYTNGPDVLSSLHFTLSSYDGNKNQPEELKGLTFKNNQLIGTPTLQGADTYKKIEVKATVKLGDNGEEKEISIPITIVEAKMINSVDVATKPHIYNGLPHNQRQVGTGTSEDYVLDVKMTKDIMGDPLPADDVLSLVEGVDYYISKVNYENGESKETLLATDKQSVSIIDAGTYSSIEITALEATFDSDLTPIQTGKYSLPEEKVIVVDQRPMNISISFNKESIEEDEELTWDDVTVTPEALGAQRGIVAKDAEDFKEAVSGSISYTLNEEGTIATVRISGVKVDDKGEFSVSNYELTINGEEYTGGIDDDIIIEVPVDYSSTGGTTDKRYQLYLANKDYLDNGKTEEFYDKLGLELFSRHNKKYEKAGGSFTIWYEKDGVANDGNYRIFWSNRANGEYKEVKFDPVSEYFRIDNVHSDVYVKIYDADGFPVANEAITAQDFRAYAQANKIIVITPEPTDVQIISMAGAVVAADKVTGQREFANLAEDVYIVRMGETIVKLQVRN